MNQTELLDQFILEARECLEQVSQRLLQVEKSPSDAELLNLLVHRRRLVAETLMTYQAITAANQSGQTLEPRTVFLSLLTLEYGLAGCVQHGASTGEKSSTGKRWRPGRKATSRCRRAL